MTNNKGIWKYSKLIQYQDTTDMSVDKVLNAFDLNWNVRLWQAYAINPENNDAVSIENRWVTVRENHDKSDFPLEVVGGKYKITQNWEFIDLLNGIRKAGYAEFVAGNYIKNGQGVYVIMKLNKDVSIEGDPHSSYLIARTSHDGSCSVSVSPLIMRIQCTNAITSAILKAKTKYSIKHTTNNTFSLDALLAKVKLVSTHVADYSMLANRLLNTSYSDAEFETLLTKQFEIPSHILVAKEDMLSRGDKIVRNRALNYRDYARKAWYGDGQDTQNAIKNTRYGAFQAIIESIDHRGTEMSESQAMRIILDNDSQMKDKAYSLILQGV